MPPRPNIVFVLTDDQGYGDLGCHGNRVIRTPCLDRFHREAVRFTDYHVGSTCAPTRAGLLTGHYCNSAGVWHTIGGRSLLRADEWTLADALAGAGHRTGHFGKWHLGDSPPYRPHERGFAESIYHAGGGIGNTGDAWGNDYSPPRTRATARTSSSVRAGASSQKTPASPSSATSPPTRPTGRSTWSPASSSHTATPPRTKSAPASTA